MALDDAHGAAQSSPPSDTADLEEARALMTRLAQRARVAKTFARLVVEKMAESAAAGLVDVYGADADAARRARAAAQAALHVVRNEARRVMHRAPLRVRGVRATSRVPRDADEQLGPDALRDDPC